MVNDPANTGQASSRSGGESEFGIHCEVNHSSGKFCYSLPDIARAVLMIAFFALGQVTMPAACTNVFFFSNYDDTLSWEEHSTFTNWFEMMYLKPLPAFLPTNFVHRLYNEITKPSFEALISRGVRNSTNLNKHVLFAAAVCDGMDRAGVAIDANIDLSPSASPVWVKRLRFYIESRFGGHTIPYVEDAIEEEASPTNVALPFGFPPALKREYWIPSKWIEKDTMTLDRLELGLPKPRIVESNQLWVVRDGRLAWIYCLISGMPFSQCRDGKEYGPAYKDKFEAATKTAWQQIKRQSTVFLDPQVVLDQKVKKILEQKYDILWMTPEGLN